MTPEVKNMLAAERAKVRHLISYELGIRGWNQKRVAASLGYTGEAVSKVVNGKGHSEAVLNKMKEVGVPEALLFDPRDYEMHGCKLVKKQQEAV